MNLLSNNKSNGLLRELLCFKSTIKMLRWITVVPLVAVVLLQGRPSEAATVNANEEAVANEQQIINDERTKPLRYRRRRILQVEDSPIFKDEAFGFIEMSSNRIAGHPNKRADAAYRPSSIRNVVDIDVWSRLLQDDMSMSMPSPTATDPPIVVSPTPTSSPAASETDAPTADAPVVVETDAPTSDAPVVMETDAPVNTPSEASECDSLNRTNAIRTLLDDELDIPVDGDVPLDSPQGMALDWITNDDNATDPCTESESTITRFALATFYYSTNGENWTDSTNWISATESQCTWYGITCNDDGNVDAFQLGTYFSKLKTLQVEWM